MHRIFIVAMATGLIILILTLNIGGAETRRGGTIAAPAAFLFVKIAKGGTMQKRDNEQIVETATEARGAERGPTVRNVLVAGTGLVIAAFVVIYFVYFAH
jgi:hypothetical protein